VSRRFVLPLLVAGSIPLGCLASHYRSNPQIATVEGDPIVQMAERGRFPSATLPPMVPLSQHSARPGNKQRLIALTTPIPRAYPIGLLDRFEVVNDSAAGLDYVVTRCALTHVAAVYGRKLDGRELRFENSGALWRDTLVLRDAETGTLWSAATGAALFGPLAGQRLAPIPAVYTTVRAWSRSFPDSTYMDLRRPTSIPFFLRLYGASPWQGLSGVRSVDRRFAPKEELFSVAVGQDAFAFTARQIRERRTVRSQVNGHALTVSWDDRLEAPRAHIAGEERPAFPMYWFALDRHFESVVTLPTSAAP
jgi:uncharacterized protein DUF3179